QAQAVDIEIHYVLRRGDTGIYTYAILDHPAEYPATSIGEWRMVWKLPDDLLDTIVVDKLRYRKMPTAADISRAEPTAIGEIVKLTTGSRRGLFECKYDYNADYHETPFWGHADSRSGLGAWLVFGSHEWFNDGPTKQDLTSADRILHVHFGMNHYNGSSTTIAAGESWRKIYGPFLLYMNRTNGGTDNAIRDVRKRLEKERSAWPYAWLDGQPEYPLSEGRGDVTGRLVIEDPAKPAVTGAGAWVGVAQPDPGGNWQFESKRYQYWTRAAADGSFRIPHVRPGTYRLSAFVDGAFEEFDKEGIEVSAGGTTALGEVRCEIPRPRGKLVWEIGTPDRSAAEFRHGDDYFQGFLWKNFGKEWPNPLEFTIGRSDPAKDWNYAHSAYPVDGNRFDPWKWRIHFELDHAPQADATLTIGIASADRARLHVFANDESKPAAVVDPKVQGGNALLREAIHAKYCYHRVPIPAAMLRKGKNTITLVQSRTYAPGFHVMYDALSLEVP
ncbi:MAG: hypothetical protein KDN05_21610, partial [Verrucomicrobiae bacterium]|nr:hypothetical protein [Verrucomicrobiae bacterium]